MRWTVYDPGRFPPSWHRAMQGGLGDKFADHFYTLTAAKQAQKRFQLFRLSLRNHPLHPSSQAHEAAVHRTRIAWNPDSRMWELRLLSRALAFDEIANLSDFS